MRVSIGCLGPAIKAKGHVSKLVSLYARKVKDFLGYPSATSIDVSLAASATQPSQNAKIKVSSITLNFLMSTVEGGRKLLSKPSYSARHTKEQLDQASVSYSTIFKHTF